MKRVLMVAVLSVVLMLAISVPALAAELQVPSQYPTIQAAIDAATYGDTVLVAPGTYSETIDFDKDGVTLQGAGSSLSMIRGSGAWVSSAGPTSRIDGFSIRGLIRNYSSSLTISNNTIWGGIYNYHSSPYIESNIVVGSGAAIENDEYCSPTITNNIIMGVDGIDNYLSSPTITNNTITTLATNKGMFGIRLIGTDYPQATITNNIITNFADGIVTLPSGSPSTTTPHPIVAYNDFWANDQDLPGSMTGASNIFQDPEFVAPGLGLLSDFHLRPWSPCIDVGSDAAPGLSATDFGGDPRIHDGNDDGAAVVDMGAYEYWNLQPTARAGADQTLEQMSLEGTVVTLDGSGSYDFDGDTLSYSWTWDGGAATGVNPTVVLPAGTTTVTLVVSDGTFDSPPDAVLITVNPATVEGLDLLVGDLLEGGGIDVEMEVSLLAKVNAAMAALAKDNPSAVKGAINNLKALINQVEAQTGKKITEEAAAAIIAKANAVIAALGG